MKNESKINCTGTHEIVCPYCGYEQMDSWESANESDDEECYNCGKHYTYTSETSRYFYSSKAPCLNGEPHVFSEWRSIENMEGDEVFSYRRCVYCNNRETSKQSEVTK